MNNEKLSDELISLYRKIDLNKKVKLDNKSDQSKSKQTYMESILHQQSALSMYFEGSKTYQEGPIETTDQFKDYLVRNGLISQKLRDKKFIPNSEIIKVKRPFDDVETAEFANKIQIRNRSRWEERVIPGIPSRACLSKTRDTTSNEWRNCSAKAFVTTNSSVTNSRPSFTWNKSSGNEVERLSYSDLSGLARVPLSPGEV